MSDPESESQRNSPASEDTQPDQLSQGPNLVLLYSLIVLALIAAIGFALMIVLPFYRRR